MFLSVLLLTCVGITKSNAQPGGNTYHSLEAKIISSDRVIVGTINNEKRHILKRPKRFDSGEYEYTFQVSISEIVKGDPGLTTTESLRSPMTYRFDNRYREWSAAETVGIWFLGPAPAEGENRNWEFLPLGEKVESEEDFASRASPPMFANDLTVLSTPKEILERALAFSKMPESSQSHETQTVVVDPEMCKEFGSGMTLDNRVALAVLPSSESLAQRMIHSPESFYDDAASSQPEFGRQLKAGGVNLIRHFKSDQNIELVRNQLKLDGTDQYLELGVMRPIRHRALEVLLHWNEISELPAFANEMDFLDLKSMGCNSESLSLVGEMQSLKRIDLRDVPLELEGLRSVLRCKKLSLIDVDAMSFNDEIVQLAMNAGSLHKFGLATTYEDSNRPKSNEEVESLYLMDAKITDSGLEELANLGHVRTIDLRNTKVTDQGLNSLRHWKNLEWIYLNGTSMTDEGLKSLAELKSLKRVFLEDTDVSQAAVTELRAAIPECRVSSSFDDDE
jgi:hypothetical protein